MLLALAPTAQALDLPNQLLDLETARTLALENNPGLAATRERVAQASARLREAQAAWLPQLDAQASASRIKTADRDAPTAFDNPADWYRAELKATWTLFDGFQREYTILAARHENSASEADRSDAIRLLSHHITQTYLRCLLVREEEKIARADLDFYERLASEAAARQTAGTGSQSDLLGFRVRANEARASLIETRRLAYNILAALAELMGLDPFALQTIQLAPLPPGETIDLSDYHTLLQTALRNRPDLQRADKATAASVASVRAARGDYYPHLHLSGSYGGDRRDNGSFQSDDLGYTVAATVSFNLFDGGMTRSRVARAIAQQREEAYNAHSLRLAIAREVADALSDLETARQQLDLQTENLDLVRQTRNLVEKEYQAGQESFTRLNEAQRDFVTAESRHIRASTQLQLARQTLETILFANP
jgi:outer membrane protein TolC